MIDRPARRVVTTEPLNAAATPNALRSPITDRAAFFTRSHFPAPEANADWTVSVDGLVKRPREWTLEELRARDVRSLTVTLECAGNGRTRFDHKPGGTPWELGAVSTARFTGTPLGPILEAAGLTGEAREVLFVGADAGETKSGTIGPYERSLPVDVARHPDTMLVWAMNDEPLLCEHGHPIRLLVPGWYGMASVKWLREIRAIAEPFRGFFQVEDYVFRKRAGVADGTPLDRMAVNTMILEPDPAEAREATLTVSGIAWSGYGRIVRVEYTDDDGETWREATLEPSTSRYAHQAWTFECSPRAAGTRKIYVRATDASGNTQPRSAPWNELGYQNNSWSEVTIYAD